MARACGRCGAGVPDEAVYCRSCGSTAVSAAPPPITPDGGRLVVSLDEVPPDRPKGASAGGAFAGRGGPDPNGDLTVTKGRAGPKAGPTPLVPAGGGGTGGSASATGGAGARQWPWAVAALATVIAMVAGSVTLVMIRSRRSHPERVALESVDHRSSHPFTPSFVNEKAARVRRPSAARHDLRPGGTLRGDQAQLYGSGRQSVCDTEALIRALEADPRVARAWAGLMGVAVDGIPGTVRSLAPVLLNHDTAVTNHEYRDGRPRSFPAVLQAGTAVLVDILGRPRVKCSCGNPLLPGPDVSADVTVVGPRWEGYRTEQVVNVVAALQRITTLVTTDIESGRPIETTVGRPGTTVHDPNTLDHGGTVSLDGFLVSDDRGVHVVSDDGAKRTTVIDHPVADAFDDGVGGLIYSELPAPAGNSQGSSDEVTQVPGGGAEGRAGGDPVASGRSRDEAAILYLPAGSSEPVRVVDPGGSGSDAGTWAVAQASGTLDGRRVLAYLRMRSDRTSGGEATGDLILKDLASGTERTVEHGVVGPGLDLDAVGIAAGKLAYSQSKGGGGSRSPGPGSPVTGDRGSHRWIVRDAAGKKVDSPCSAWKAEGEEGAEEVCPIRGTLAAGPVDGKPWLVGEIPAASAGGRPTLVAVDVSTGKRSSWSVPLKDPPGTATGWDRTFDAFDGRAVVSYLARSGRSGDPTPGDPAAAERRASLVDLQTGRAVERPISGTARFLRAPLERPGGAVEEQDSQRPGAEAAAMIAAAEPVPPGDYAVPFWGPSFDTPDHDITCSISDGVFCQLDSRADLPPEPSEGCRESWEGGLISLSPGEPFHDGWCTGGQLVAETGKVLPDGASLENGDHVCTVVADRVTCIESSTGRGFTAARTGVVPF